MGYIKKPDSNTKPVKYFLNKKKGMSKKEAAEKSGYINPKKNTTQIEQTKTYQAAEKDYKDILKDKISLDEAAKEHKKNIRQDKDRGAKQNALKDYYKIQGNVYPTEQGEIEVGDVIIKFGKGKE